MIVDEVVDKVPRWEDSLKVLGIVGWTTFLVRAAVSTLAGPLERTSPDAPQQLQDLGG